MTSVKTSEEKSVSRVHQELIQTLIDTGNCPTRSNWPSASSCPLPKSSNSLPSCPRSTGLFCILTSANRGSFTLFRQRQRRTGWRGQMAIGGLHVFGAPSA